ncbi:MAG: TRAP transporter small permease [Gammaproteobacteria bacterium]|nr:TRAP transporter small permease [Gammaproteobacteria bacterium]MDH4316430.1 TRAP transporter small permease [Gammaproteobacteria bacterium]MDH5214313.1 TRAP transporter small permease [Gammaproteobacteria bacterium]
MVKPTGGGLLNRLERWGTAIENGSLVVLLSAMMLLAVGQIVMRIFFSFGFVWADELLKLMVLWIALIASVAASRNDRHLRIDVLSHFVPQRYARIPRIVVDLFASVMCGLLAWQSYRFVQLSIEFEETVLVDIPAWFVHGIAPVAFALMCYRFLLASVAGTIRVFSAADEVAPLAGDGSR